MTPESLLQAKKMKIAPAEVIILLLNLLEDDPLTSTPTPETAGENVRAASRDGLVPDYQLPLSNN